MEDAKNEQLLILSLSLGYIALQQVHGISISKCRLQPVKQVANNRQRIRWPRAAPHRHRWCGSGASRDVITSSVASTVVSDACSLLKSDDYMCKCGRPLSPKLPLPPSPHLSAFGLTPPPPLSANVLYGWPQTSISLGSVTTYKQ